MTSSDIPFSGAGPLRFLLRAGGWLLAAAALLVVGFVLFALAIVALSLGRSGELRINSVQLIAARLLFQGVLVEMLLPQLAASFASWVVLARIVPRLDAGWRSLVAGLPLVAALWFPVIAARFFHMWEPQSASDYVKTLLLTTGAVSIALLAPRRLLRPLRPGCLAAGDRRAMVAP